MDRYKTTATICLVVSLIGIMHAMNHHTFYRLFTRSLYDVDMLVKSIVNYFSISFVPNDRNELNEVAQHYDILINNAQPLLNLIKRDLRILIDFFNNLEIIQLAERLMYAYFRQSAINLIDHLKRVYELY